MNEDKDYHSICSILRDNFQFRVFFDIKNRNEEMVEIILMALKEWLEKVLPEYKDTLEKYLYLIPDNEYEDE